MKFYKLFAATAISFVIITNSVGVFWAAPSFTDVPPDHWANSSISHMVDRGVMMGDTTGKFRPNDFIDKFETAKIFARLVGYNYTKPSITEKNYYEKAYEKNKSLLDTLASIYAKWNSSSNREISYLLEKEIFVTEDLNKFILKDDAGTERLRALSLEEASLFFVKFIDNEEEALSLARTYNFEDDNEISENLKPYIYYLHSKNILRGDGSGYIRPKTAVTRAMFAVLADNTLEYTGLNASINGQTTDVVDNTKGYFKEYHPTMGVIEYITPEGETKIAKLSENVSIYIDGYLKTAGDLRDSMGLSLVTLNKDIIVEITTSANITSTVKETKDNSNIIPAEIIKPNNKPPENVEDDTKVIPSNSRLDSSGLDSSKDLQNLKNAKLIDKKIAENTGYKVLVIEDSVKQTYELIVTENSFISRRNSGQVKWNELRIGDLVDCKMEDGQILEIYAYGILSTVTGIVTSIYLSDDFSYITFMNDSTNKEEKYYIITSSNDIYSFRLNSKVELRLDSKEIESFTVLS